MVWKKWLAYEKCAMLYKQMIGKGHQAFGCVS